jgi:tetratricopeptide (TPR) repeat protein
MNSDRIKTLEQWIKEDPNDPFNKYGLAIELLQTESERAEALFDELLKDHPNYLPTYYMAANLFAGRNQPEKAIGILERGIELAKKQNNEKALRELKSELEALRF